MRFEVAIQAPIVALLIGVRYVSFGRAGMDRVLVTLLLVYLIVIFLAFRFIPAEDEG